LIRFPRHNIENMLAVRIANACVWIAGNAIPERKRVASTQFADARTHASRHFNSPFSIAGFGLA
jgi:hypothetical protein